MRGSVAGTFALLIAVVGTAGCVPAATVEPSTTPMATASAGMQTTLPTQSQGASPTLPEVPVALPVMPGAQAVEPQPADPGTIARWMVDAIGPDVYAFYLDALPAAGFVIEERYPGGNVAIIRFSTPDGTTLDLALVGEGDGDRTRIDLQLPEGP
jgi:hypothetical protein